MEIIKAVESDIEAIFKLNYELLGESERWQKDMLDADFNLSTYLVAKVNGNVVAFISYRVVLDECEIFQVCVHKDFQRQKIASKLLNTLIEKERIKTIFLEVNTKNISAIKFYKKQGFTILSERKNYYKSDCAYNMMLSLWWQ